MSPWEQAASLVKRIQFPEATSWGNAVLTERQRDAWAQAGKYGRGWVYFSIVLLALSTAIRFYQSWGDRIRIALHKESPRAGALSQSPQDEYELPSAATDSSTTLFFPAQGPIHTKQQQSSVSTVAPLNNAIAFVRWIFYRSLPEVRFGRYKVVFPSLGASAIILAALIFVTLYCFLPQPLYYSSIRIGSPPLAVRAGMLAVAMVPWIVAMSTRANFISMLTGIGHERLNVLHRWAGYICLFLSLIHTIPFYVTPVWEHGMLKYYQMNQPNIYIYGTGVAALVHLAFLCVHSLPILRDWMYELFLKVHLPVSVIFVAMLFWHTKNYLSSWAYLWSTLAILLLSYVVRLAYLNWTNPLRLSFMIGEDSAVTILPQNAIKVTVPTQMRWNPGQYVYLRMPRVAFFQNHPFTVASLCSNDFPSEYGEEYRDLAVVFRPAHGFTREVLRKSVEYGPFKTWTAFLEGPYGGMRRQMAAFDDVVFFAGGSGITAIASHLLDLIKKMREGKAVTKTVRVIWALRDPESIDWFKEELRICRDHAPLNTVHCHFYLTGAKDDSGHSFPVQDQQLYRDIVQEKIYDTLQEIEKRSSAYIREEAAGDLEREKELRRENEDTLTALPRAYTSNLPRSSNYQSPMSGTAVSPYQSPYQSPYNQQQPQFPQYQHPYLQQQTPYVFPQPSTNIPFDFGFDQSQSQLQQQPQSQSPLQDVTKAPPQLTVQTVPVVTPRPQNPRFASLPLQKRNGWKIEYTRPDIPRMLNELSKGFGRRTCVYVCGPPSMRMAVSDAVARLQWSVMTDSAKDEIYLHTENYNI
ncbi:ferric reductase NAD binding domain-containing protein [Aspergillus unguis]